MYQYLSTLKQIERDASLKMYEFTINCFDITELNDLRKIICLRNSEVTVERISVCNVIEKWMEHGIHCLPCSYTNDIIDMLPY